MKQFLVLFLVIACVSNLQAQEASVCMKRYADIANHCIPRDSLQKMQEWVASIASNKIRNIDTLPMSIVAKSYRQAVNYVMIGKSDSAFYFLNVFLDNSIADYMVLVDPYLKPLRLDTIRWEAVIHRIEQGYLNSLDSSVNKEYALELFYLGIEDQKYRYYYPILNLNFYGNGMDDYVNDSVFDQLVNKYGFPSIALVGTHAAKVGFALIQHTTFSKNYRKRYRAVVRAYKNNDYDPQCYAKVKDRWLLQHHRRQLYGTNWLKSTEKRFVKKYGDHYILEPVRNFRKLNDRRAELGLESIEDYMKDYPDYMIPANYYPTNKRLKSYSFN